jgi:two-component system nitrate/nitrite response regulator NarL
MDRISVVLADDHPIVLDATSAAIASRPDLRLLGTAVDGRAALAMAREKRPDVLVLDLDMPEMDGFAVLEALRREQVPTKTIVMSAVESGALIYRILRLGAVGYLAKTATAAALCDAVAAAGRGQSVIPAHLHGALADEVRLRRPAPDGPTLSPRELQIVRMTADGMTTAEIAQHLHLSPATIKSHLQHAFEKLGVSDRAAAVAKAMRAGLLD